MQVYLQIAQWLLAIGEIFLCYCFIDILGSERCLRKNIFSTVAWSVFIGTLLAINRSNTTLLSWAMLILQSILIFLSLIKKQKKVLLGGITIAYNTCIAFFQLFFAFMIMSLIKNVGVEEAYLHMSVYRIYCYLLSVLMCLVVLVIVSEFRKSNTIKMDLYKDSLYFFSLSGILAITIFQDQMNSYGKDKSTKNAIFLFVIIIAIIIFLITSIRGAQKKAALEIQEEKNKMTEEHYLEIRSMYENYSYTYHDIKNHLIILENYCETGENEKAIQYIEKLQKPIKKIEKYIDSGNEVVDVILNFKVSTANRKGIHTDIVIEKIDDIGVEEHDLCAVFSNLLDNAIEACELITVGEKWIRICAKRTGDVFIIKISNSYLGKYKSGNNGYTTLKKGFHGYGMKSVKARVEKYGGVAEWGHDGAVFIAVMTFFL